MDATLKSDEIFDLNRFKQSSFDFEIFISE